MTGHPYDPAPGSGTATGGPVSVELPLHDPSQVGEARRAALLLADRAALDETTRGHLALVATEAATNLARHATQGLLLLRPLAAPADGLGAGAEGVEVVAVDRGPGMTDLVRHLRDGFSTAGTAGHGLGAMGRLAHEFDLHSLPGAGTVLVARLWTRAARDARAAARAEHGVVCRAMAGDAVCGDAWAVAERGARTVVLVADGLGHGPYAAEASEAAVRIFREAAAEPPAEIVARCHAALRATRGAAVAVAAIDWEERRVRFAGVGNVAASLLAASADERSRSFASMNGIVGHQMRAVNEFTERWPEGGTLVLHTDGLTTRWKLDAYPGLAVRHPALTAAALWRDFTRGRDDVTVLALRESRGLGARV